MKLYAIILVLIIQISCSKESSENKDNKISHQVFANIDSFLIDNSLLYNSGTNFLKINKNVFVFQAEDGSINVSENKFQSVTKWKNIGKGPEQLLQIDYFGINDSFIWVYDDLQMKLLVMNEKLEVKNTKYINAKIIGMYIDTDTTLYYVNRPGFKNDMDSLYFVVSGTINHKYSIKKEDKIRSFLSKSDLITGTDKSVLFSFFALDNLMQFDGKMITHIEIESPNIVKCSTNDLAKELSGDGMENYFKILFSCTRYQSSGYDKNGNVIVSHSIGRGDNVKHYVMKKSDGIWIENQVRKAIYYAGQNTFYSSHLINEEKSMLYIYE